MLMKYCFQKLNRKEIGHKIKFIKNVFATQNTTNLRLEQHVTQIDKLFQNKIKKCFLCPPLKIN